MPDLLEQTKWGYIVSFRLDSAVFVREATITEALKDDSRVFDSFVDDQRMPGGRFNDVEALRKAFIQNEKWWMKYKEDLKDDAKIMASRIAIGCLLGFYPTAGLGGSDCDTLYLWQKDEERKDNEHEYMAITKVVDTLALNVVWMNFGKSVIQDNVRYGLAGAGRDNLRLDYMEPRIQHMWRFDLH